MTARPPFSRILLALSSAGSGPSLEFSARLAVALEIPLEALFIEDEDLLAVAALPFTRETTRLGRVLPIFDPTRLECDFRRDATYLRRLAQRCLAAGSVEWHFRTIRGQTARALAGAAEPGDLLALPRGLGPLTGRGRLSSAVRAALEGDWAALLLLDETLPIPPGPIAVYFDGSLEAVKALALAQRLSRHYERPLNALLPSGSPTETHELQRTLLGMLPAATPVNVIVLQPASGRTPLDQLARARAGLLVLADRPLSLSGARLDTFLQLCRAPLLLLRAHE